MGFKKRARGPALRKKMPEKPKTIEQFAQALRAAVNGEIIKYKKTGTYANGYRQGHVDGWAKAEKYWLERLEE